MKTVPLHGVIFVFLTLFYAIFLTVPPGTHCCVEDRGLLRGGAPSGQVSPRGKRTSRTMVLSENN